MKYTEAKLEQAVIELLQKQNYIHVNGETLKREANEVLIKEDVKHFLKRFYRTL